MMINPPLMTTNEEENSKIAGDKRKCANVNIIESLPDELVLEVLLHVPAEDIQNAARLVCKKWYDMIRTPNFVLDHFHHSSSGLLIRNMRTGHHTFMTMRQGRIAMSKFNYDFKHRISASCNGLILETLDDTDHNKSRKTLSVANPATNQRLPLPPLPLKMSRYWCSVIAYDAASLKYKVVVIYDRSWINIVHDCAILAVGVDKPWRDVNTQHISERNSWLLCCNVLITQGFVHWHSGQGTHVINLNLETEVLTEIRIPQGYDEQGSKYYLSTDRSLTLFIECGRFLWDVWEMMNAEESGGEWTKVFKIDMEGPMWRLQKMMIHTSPHKPQTKWLVMPRRGARPPYTASDSGLRCLRCSYTRSRLLYVNHRLW